MLVVANPDLIGESAIVAVPAPWKQSYCVATDGSGE